MAARPSVAASTIWFKWSPSTSLTCFRAGMAQGPLQFQADADEAARLAMLERLEAAVAARPSMATLAAILEALSQALQDPSPAVLKRAIPAAYVAFRCSQRLLAVPKLPGTRHAQ